LRQLAECRIWSEEVLGAGDSAWISSRRHQPYFVAEPREALAKLGDVHTIAAPIANICVESQEKDPHRARLQIPYVAGLGDVVKTL